MQNGENYSNDSNDPNDPNDLNDPNSDPIMKTLTILVFYLLPAILSAQVPYEHYYHPESFPRTSDKISFNLLHPFTDFKDSVPDKKSTYQCLTTIPGMKDSLLSQYVKYSMLSLGFEEKYINYRNGAEIWYGVSKTTIPTVAAIYYRPERDSTRLYVFTGYSMTYFDKKPKADLAKEIAERIRRIGSKKE